jgi:hypothetical protein
MDRKDTPHIVDIIKNSTILTSSKVVGYEYMLAISDTINKITSTPYCFIDINFITFL